ncbi:hypothetical protein [Fibrella arboris]|uniref:hypothetical protein n=1 Tax=Fibrella arboris TaxID=3242486 RepID=UPI0035218DA7
MGLLLTGCNLGVYAPAHQNVPLFQKKGEAQVSINTTNLQAAVAVSNHVGVAVNAFAVINGKKFLTPSGEFAVNQRRAEVAVGYVTLRKTPESPIAEVYLGGGMGTTAQRWSDPDPPASTSASSGTAPSYRTIIPGSMSIPNWNVYVQPAIGIRRRKGSISFSTKINYTGYGTATILPENTPPVDARSDSFERLNHSHTLFIEPAFTVAAAGPTFRIMLQLFGWFPVVNQNKFDVIHSDQTFMRLGMQWRLNQRRAGIVTPRTAATLYP